MWWMFDSLYYFIQSHGNWWLVLCTDLQLICTLNMKYVSGNDISHSALLPWAELSCDTGWSEVSTPAGFYETHILQNFDHFSWKSKFIQDVLSGWAVFSIKLLKISRYMRVSFNRSECLLKFHNSKYWTIHIQSHYSWEVQKINITSLSDEAERQIYLVNVTVIQGTTSYTIPAVLMVPPQFTILPSDPLQFMDVAVVIGAENALSRSARAAYLSPPEKDWTAAWGAVVEAGTWPLPTGWSGANG